MNLNWERLSLSGYFEALEAYNEAHATPGETPPRPSNPERFGRFLAAHGLVH